jgi:hypothetical protein
MTLYAAAFSSTPAAVARCTTAVPRFPWIHHIGFSMWARSMGRRKAAVSVTSRLCSGCKTVRMGVYRAAKEGHRSANECRRRWRARIHTHTCVFVCVCWGSGGGGTSTRACISELPLQAFKQTTQQAPVLAIESRPPRPPSAQPFPTREQRKAQSYARMHDRAQSGTRTIPHVHNRAPLHKQTRKYSHYGRTNPRPPAEGARLIPADFALRCGGMV